MAWMNLSYLLIRCTVWQGHCTIQQDLWKPELPLSWSTWCSYFLGVLGWPPEVLARNQWESLICRRSEGEEARSCVDFWKCSSVGKNTILILINHTFWALLWAQFLQSMQWLWMPLLATGTLIERQRRHQFKLPWTPFLSDLGHPNHPPKPF